MIRCGQISIRCIAAAASVDADPWQEQSDTAFARIADQFRRVEPRRQTRSGSDCCLRWTLGCVWQQADVADAGSVRLQFEAMIVAARTSTGPFDFALVAMLGVLGLRVFEVCNPYAIPFASRKQIVRNRR